MGIFSFLKAGAGASAAAPMRVEPPVVASAAPVESESQWRGFTPVGGVSKAGVRVDERAALSLPATLQALRVISGVFAMAPLHLYSRSSVGRQRMDGVPAEVLLASRPNGFQTPFDLFELLMADLLLAGNFYAYVSRNMRGDPVALTRLEPQTVLVAKFFDRAEGTILFYDATLPDGSRERFPARDIWHVRGMSRDGLVGLNPVQYSREALGGAIATADHSNRFWNKGGRPSTVLTTTQKVSPEDKMRIRSDWDRIHSGPDGSAIAVLDQDLKSAFLTHNLKDSQFLETRQFQVVDLARIWGVPPHLIFELSKATFSNIEHQSLEFLTYHLGPHFTRVAQAATRQFAPEGMYFEHVTDALVRGDLKSRMEAYWLQRQMGIVNANELRRRENENNIPGEAGTEYWRPSNMALAGRPMPEPQELQQSREDADNAE
ncbi:portal protein [Gemmobacter lanyuensis]|uniref:Portal protein n=1 Tax=Gemmobacter lanyuensis TaxID=1054497 RepID=A0A918MID4_9RHOB|nr:phage portal protein [Gemmobacter lanyuensis]GGW24027.1 portal protein [Gemmobacter lanyuensis]